MSWIKWWKSAFFLKLFLTILLTMGVTLALALLGVWYIAIVVAVIGGLVIRKIVTNKLDEIARNG